MLSSKSDTSPEATPTGASPSQAQGKGTRQANLNLAGDGNDAAQNKGKTPPATRRKNLTSEKGRVEPISLYPFSEATTN
jgi:hypothetical protein